MPTWEVILIVALIWLLVGLVVGLAFGKLLKLNRLYLEGLGIDRVARAIRKFLDRPQDGSVRFVIIKREQYDEFTTEEAAGIPDACVVCREYGLSEDEDARPPLAVIGGSHIPLCSGHKQFVLEFEELIEKLVDMEESVDGTPSE